MPSGTFQYPCPCGEPRLTHTSTEDPSTPAGSFGSVACGITASFLWVLAHVRFCLCLQDWSICFSQSRESPVIISHWPSRPDSLGIPNPFVGCPGWEAWCVVQNLHNTGRTSLVLLFSSLWVTHLAGMGFDFIVLHPSYHLVTASSLSLDMRYLFFFLVGSSILLLVVFQQFVEILVFLQEMSRRPSTLPSWTRGQIQPLWFSLPQALWGMPCVCVGELIRLLTTQVSGKLSNFVWMIGL